MKGCNHSPTCYECLREIYVKHAQEDISNFPLKCYHPKCGKLVRHTQLVQHQLVQCDKELKKHHRLTTLAKAYKDAVHNMIVNCPDCDTAKIVSNKQKTDPVCCKGCGLRFLVNTTFDDHHQLLKIRENIIETTALDNALANHDKFGFHEGVVRCPKCSIAISKGGGCDHMVCTFCRKHFSWYDISSQRSYFGGKLENYNVAKAERLDKIN